MRVGSLVLTLVIVGHAWAQAPRIQGTLREGGTPVAGAEVVLQSFADEDCVKLFMNKKPKPGDEERLARCAPDLKTVYADEQGKFSFGEVPAGRYAVRVLWPVKQKPASAPKSADRGRFVLFYPGWKDKSGKYDGFAQGKPFYHSADTDSNLDFELRF